MKSPRRPARLRILGRDYAVAYDPHYENAGLCEQDANRITIKDGQPSIEEMDTLLHESIHAIWWIMDIGLPKHEEHVVRKLATGLTLVLRDNPHLVAYLTKP